MKSTKSAKKFNSKILLFGEYSIIHNSMGLSIPYEAFEGRFTFTPEKLSHEHAAESNRSLVAFAAYLRQLMDDNKLLFTCDLDQFDQDIQQGIVFDSSIPQGYGVGSSGALVAAIYDRYGLDKIPNDQKLSGKLIVRLKDIFSQMESYFHGKSSGIDPLICYMNHPMLIQNKDVIDTVGIPQSGSTGRGAIFLINTGEVGETQPLVNLFLDKCKEEGFAHVIKNELIPFNNNCIKAFLKGEVKDLFSNLKSLSGFLLSNLSPMIPRRFRHIWQNGLETEAYYLKLCGSGGGGYILGFTEDLEKAKQQLKDHEIQVIHRF
ncbi:MAG: mevalonate kinase [Candidatus Competibacteraceae bacterium]|nr:mevalonate kinase [Candidatus Competibacteraceae bacterium]